MGYQHYSANDDKSLQLKEGLYKKSNDFGFHFLCLFFTVSMWVCLPYSPLFSLLFVVAYLVESFTSSTFEYLRHLNSTEDVVSYINRVRSYQPEIGFTCECYHYETRSRTVCINEISFEQQYNSASNSYVTVQVNRPNYHLEYYQEKVITYSQTYRFRYSRWEDYSAPLKDEIKKCQAVRINFDSVFEFGNDSILNRYNAEKERFIATNKRRDAHFSCQEYCTIPGVTDKMLSVVDIRKKSPLLNSFVYLITTLLSLSWVYRLWFDRNTVQSSFCFKKRIYD